MFDSDVCQNVYCVRYVEYIAPNIICNQQQEHMRFSSSAFFSLQLWCEGRRGEREEKSAKIEKFHHFLIAMDFSIDCIDTYTSVAFTTSVNQIIFIDSYVCVCAA